MLIHIYLARFLSLNALEIQGAVFLWCTTSIYKMCKVLNLLHWYSYVFSIIKFAELTFMIVELCNFIVLLISFTLSFAVFEDYFDSIFFRFSKAPQLPPQTYLKIDGHVQKTVLLN